MSRIALPPRCGWFRAELIFRSFQPSERTLGSFCGANMAVIKMLEEIHASGDDGSKFMKPLRRERPSSWLRSSCLCKIMNFALRF